MVDAMRLDGNASFNREQALDWFRANYPLVKEGTVVAHLARLSTNNRNRLYYSARPDDDILYQIGPGLFRRFDPGQDPAPIHEGTPQSERADEAADSDAAPTPTSSEFAYEQDLRDYLARNLHMVESGLRLYEEESVTGIEFPAGGRFIDILATAENGDYVVIELKVSRGYDRTVGQLLRYMSWVELHHADNGQSVRGVIVAKAVTDDLRLACRRLQGIKLFEYRLSVSLEPVSIGGR